MKSFQDYELRILPNDSSGVAVWLEHGDVIPSTSYYEDYSPPYLFHVIYSITKEQ